MWTRTTYKESYLPVGEFTILRTLGIKSTYISNDSIRLSMFRIALLSSFYFTSYVIPVLQGIHLISMEEGSFQLQLARIEEAIQAIYILNKRAAEEEKDKKNSSLQAEAGIKVALIEQSRRGAARRRRLYQQLQRSTADLVFDRLNDQRTQRMTTRHHAGLSHRQDGPQCKLQIERQEKVGWLQYQDRLAMIEGAIQAVHVLNKRIVEKVKD